MGENGDQEDVAGREIYSYVVVVGGEIYSYAPSAFRNDNQPRPAGNVR